MTVYRDMGPGRVKALTDLALLYKTERGEFWIPLSLLHPDDRRMVRPKARFESFCVVDWFVERQLAS